MNDNEIPENEFDKFKSAMENLLEKMIECDTPLILSPFSVEAIVHNIAKAKFDQFKAKRFPYLYFSFLLFFNTILQIINKDILWSIMPGCLAISLMSFWYIQKRKWTLKKIIHQEQKVFYDEIYKASTQYEIDQLIKP